MFMSKSKIFLNWTFPRIPRCILYALCANTAEECPVKKKINFFFYPIIITTCVSQLNNKKKKKIILLIF